MSPKSTDSYDDWLAQELARQMSRRTWGNPERLRVWTRRELGQGDAISLKKRGEGGIDKSENQKGEQMNIMGHAYLLRCWTRGAIEKIVRKIAWSLPRTIAYWTFIRVFTYKNGNGPSQDIIDTMKRWEAR